MAGKGHISSRITSPSHKAKQESLHLQGKPQSQLCVINMLRHMADRSNAWRFEILNSLCKARASFEFLMREDRVGTAPRACGAWLTLPFTVQDKGRFQSPHWSPSVPGHRAAIHPGSPLFLLTSAGRAPRAFHSLTSNSKITYLAPKNQTNLPASTKKKQLIRIHKGSRIRYN